METWASALLTQAGRDHSPARELTSAVSTGDVGHWAGGASDSLLSWALGARRALPS